MHRRALLAVAVAVAAAFAAPAGFAQDKWPSKPITYIVPFGAGGTTDVLARLVTPKAATELGAFQKTEVEKWALVIKTGNIKVD